MGVYNNTSSANHNLGKHFLTSSMRLLYLLVAFLGFSRVSKASLFQARSGRWEVCPYQEDSHGRQKLLGACVPGTDCQQLKGEESLYGVETWKTFRSSISRRGRVVKTVRYKVERCNNELRDLEAENLIPDFQTFDNKICSRTAYHTDEYLVRDPEDCRRFYSCQRTLGTSNLLGTLGTRGWVARHMSCAPGTHFDGARCQAGERCLEHVDGSTTRKPSTSMTTIPSTTTTTVAPVEALTSTTTTTGAPAIMTTSILTTISNETTATTTTATTTTTTASATTSVNTSSASTATTSTTIITPSTTTTISTTTIPQTSQDITFTPTSPANTTATSSTTSSTTSTTTTTTT